MFTKDEYKQWARDVISGSAEGKAELAKMVRSIERHDPWAATVLGNVIREFDRLEQHLKQMLGPDA